MSISSNAQTVMLQQCFKGEEDGWTEKERGSSKRDTDSEKPYLVMRSQDVIVVLVINSKEAEGDVLTEVGRCCASKSNTR